MIDCLIRRCTSAGLTVSSESEHVLVIALYYTMQYCVCMPLL